MTASDPQESSAVNTVKIFNGKKFILKENEDRSSFFILTNKGNESGGIICYQDPQRPFEFIIMLKPSHTDCTEQIKAVLQIPPSYDGRYHYINIQEFQIEVRFPNVSTIPGYKPHTESQEQLPKPRRISSFVNRSEITPESLVPGPNTPPSKPEPTAQFRIPRTRDPLVTPQTKRQGNEVPARPRKSLVGDLRNLLDDEYESGSPRPSQRRRRAPKVMQPSRRSMALEDPNVGTNDKDDKMDLGN